LNEKPALWRRPKSEITDEQYKEFYEHIAHDYTAPFAWNHARVEGTQEYTYLLYAPGKAPHGIFQQDSGNGLKLYVKRIFIMDECKEFLPPYLRFMKGIVDSEDLPLNVSREILQSNKIVSQIKKTLTKKSLEMLKEKATSDAAGYQVFWKELGNVLKEGFYMNWEHTEELKELVRFESTHTEKGSYTSLKDVVSRFREGQKDLFFITGESRAALENSPHLEVFKDKGIEVIFMVDAIDEWVVQSLTEYDSKKLVNVTKGDLDLGDLTKEETEKKKEHEGEYKTFLESVAKHLNSKVKEVRLTSRLKDSPACVVAGENDMGANMERILKMSNQTFDASKKILEINPEHAISKKALKAFEADGESSDSQDWMEYLYGQALIAEGSELPDPASYVKLINKMLAQ
jgi:molecular chaperone HtpG